MLFPVRFSGIFFKRGENFFYKPLKMLPIFWKGKSIHMMGLFNDDKFVVFAINKMTELFFSQGKWNPFIFFSVEKKGWGLNIFGPKVGAVSAFEKNFNGKVKIKGVKVLGRFDDGGCRIS